MRSAILFILFLVAGHVLAAQAGKLGKACDPRRNRLQCAPLVCDAVHLNCTYCSSDDQCNSGRDAVDLVCSTPLTGTPACARKTVFPNFSWRDGVGTVVALFLSIFCGIAGIGGGALFVSLFVFLGWGKEGLELSLAIATGIALAMYGMLIVRRHPVLNRPIVDYNTVMFLQPLILAGTIPGTILKKIFPSYFLFLVLFFVLLTLMLMTWKSYFTVRASERAETLRKQKESADAAAAGASNVVEMKSMKSTTENSKPISRGHDRDEQQAGGGDDHKNLKRDPNAQDDNASVDEKAETICIDTPLDDSFMDSENRRQSTDSCSSSSSSYSSASASGCKSETYLDEIRAECIADETPGTGHLADQQTMSTPDTKPELAEVKVDDAAPNPDNSIIPVPKSDNEIIVDKILAEEARFPWLIQFLLAFIWLGVFLTAAAKESKLGGAIVCGSSKYYGVMFFFIGVLFCVTGYQAVFLCRRHSLKKRVNYKFQPGDILWTVQKMRYYPWMFFVVGVCASMLGVGGGFLMGPILLSMGVRPLVSSSTSATMTFYTASSAAVQFLIVNPAKVGYFGWFCMIGCIGGLVGRIVVQKYIIPSGVTSLIIASLMSLLTVDFVGMAVNSLRYTIIDLSEGQGFPIGTVC